MTGEDLCEHMEGHGHDHGEEKDEHVWLSLKNAKTLVGAIADALQELDPGNKDTYAANASAYIEKLSALDGAYQSAVDSATRKTVLFGDRFPFRYLVDDYGLGYYAAFAGCSAESEASFETVSFLAKKVDELGLPCVLTIEGKNHKLAETIVQSTAGKNQKVLTMDSMQSTTAKDVANGAILILDEPFNALDYKTYEDVKTIIRMLKAEGKTIFLTSHHYKDIEQLCDQVYSIEDCQLLPITEEIAARYREME